MVFSCKFWSSGLPVNSKTLQTAVINCSFNEWRSCKCEENNPEKVVHNYFGAKVFAAYQTFHCDRLNLYLCGQDVQHVHIPFKWKEKNPHMDVGGWSPVNLCRNQCTWALDGEVHVENVWALVKVKILDLSWHIFRAKEKRMQKKGKKNLQSSKRLEHIQPWMNKRSGHWKDESSPI